jgi:hypothetical protein
LNPNLINLIDLIENVQRSFSKRIPSLPYAQRLALFDLELLDRATRATGQSNLLLQGI